MDLLLTLVLACSVHFDDNLVEALAYKLSTGQQLFVGDLSTLDTYDRAKDVREARQLVASIQASGGRPAVGYMAVPVTWAARFGRSPEDLFDGCTNVGVATAMLSEYDRLCTTAPSGRRSPTAHSRRNRPGLPLPARRACVLRRLELDMNMQGIVEHVLPVATRLDRAPADHDGYAPGAGSPVFPGDGDGDWSSPGLFFPTATTIPRVPSAAPAKVVPTSAGSNLRSAQSVKRSGAGPAAPESQDRPQPRPE